jgi:hypothetical protein
MIPLIINLFSILSVALLTESAHALEQPKFEVIEQMEGVEIRRYESRIVARTLMSGDFDDAGNRGFRRLAGYIFGGNETGNKIAMTAPVDMAAANGKSEGRYWITFGMPNEYDLSELPHPEDRRVELLVEPEKYMAVLKYKGGWSEARFNKNRLRLLETMEQSMDWVMQGEPVWARYNPPFTPGFLKRNEVAIEVVRGRVVTHD